MIANIFNQASNFTSKMSKVIADELMGNPKAEKLKEEIKSLIKILEKSRDNNKLDLSPSARSELKSIAVRSHNQIYSTSNINRLEEIKSDLEKTKKKYKI